MALFAFTDDEGETGHGTPEGSVVAPPGMHEALLVDDDVIRGGHSEPPAPLTRSFVDHRRVRVLLDGVVHVPDDCPCHDGRLLSSCGWRRISTLQSETVAMS
ncbi:hypothetical protein [Streptomyces cyaneofuscatus]|uniref:hypothetical protein n=1 Tax=Streptomyces cyaneofuscatus TaxID=66883 RepID=UPI00343FDC26